MEFNSIILQLLVLSFIHIGKKVSSDVGSITKNPYCQHECNSTESVHWLCEVPCQFRSSNLKLLETDNTVRQMMLNEHNWMRSKIARGKFRDEGFDSAENMNILSYDKELEFFAICAMINRKQFSGKHCLETRTRQSVSISFFTGTIPSNRRNYPDLSTYSVVMLRFRFMEYLQKAKDYIARFPVSTSAKNAKLVEIANLLWAKTKYVGCARVRRLHVHILQICCVYSPAGSIPGEPIYTIGKPRNISHGLRGKLRSITNDLFEYSAKDDGFSVSDFPKENELKLNLPDNKTRMLIDAFWNAEDDDDPFDINSVFDFKNSTVAKCDENNENCSISELSASIAPLEKIAIFTKQRTYYHLPRVTSSIGREIILRNHSFKPLPKSFQLDIYIQILLFCIFLNGV